ncbi:hypothetical protein AVEN_3890-1 [Araneus ventricosus]|uniref:Uncharacterized protein n=1 Tax=Araneus ventricosus TaxID=182803 RepID=A0A4Y2H1L0_ARAVE|nr:hypothetical protein AVEN_7745-1 [Araneus ventricosus]GBM59106.1 hypothetical protein AVEN_48518-1 [Araneus ventricosus]GBM80368.1 hypothetical protein AVEN_78619-1 [Araneus ventricosus]GBM80439.1 hypothetical protein AVEN_3890-1 [Araneus ventricosus]
MAVNIPHVEHQSSHFYAEFIARIQNLGVFLFQSLVFFFFQNLVLPSLRPPLSLLYKNQMSCQALPSSLLPVPTVKLFSIGNAYKQYQINCARTPNCPQKLANQTSNALCTPQRLADSRLES